MVSAVVQAGLMLPMIAYFHRLSVTGLTANLLIVPIMDLVVLSGFSDVITGSQWLANLAAYLLSWARVIAAWHATFEPPVRLADPPLWLIATFLASIVILWCGASFSLRRASALPFLACLVLLITQPFTPTYEPGNLEVTTLDVGQGDGLLAGC